MRTLGILGGMAWPSTADAYRLINEEVGQRLGGVHSASLVVISYDFAEIEALQTAGRWAEAGRLLAEGASRLEKAGAEGIFLCTNTMHKVASQIESATTIPLLHIADATAAAIQLEGIGRVGLLGTRFTMQEDFYRGRLARHGVQVLVPNAEDAETVHSVIYEELVRGQVRPESRQLYGDIIEDLVAKGAEGIIAGCTEIELLVHPDDVSVAYFPTTRIHVLSAVDWILASDDGHEVGQHQIQTQHR